MLPRLQDKVLDALSYFGFYRSAPCMGSHSVRTAFALHLFFKVYCTRTALEDGFVSYDSETSKSFDLENDVVLGTNRDHGSSVAPLSVHLSAAAFVHRVGILRGSLKSVRRDYDEHCIVHSDTSEPNRETGVYGVSLVDFLDQELLWDQAAET